MKMHKREAYTPDMGEGNAMCGVAFIRAVCETPVAEMLYETTEHNKEVTCKRCLKIIKARKKK